MNVHTDNSNDTLETHTVLDANNIVGESIVWDSDRQTLFWVDIIGRQIHGWNSSKNEHLSWPTPEIVTSFGLHKSGHSAVVGLRKRIALWDFDQQFSTLANIEPDQPLNRLNEGVLGPDGAFWVGTMQDNIGIDDAPRDVTENRGHVYKVYPDGAVIKLSDDVFGITNTMVWREDNTFIVDDTLANALYAYTLDGATGQLVNRRVYQQNFDRGLPDGSCLDADGYVWNCRVIGGSCVARFAPDGSLDRLIELPCSWQTSCCFGGPDLDELYVTSARFTLSDEHLARHPLEGGLFRVRPGVRGVQPFRFG